MTASWRDGGNFKVAARTTITAASAVLLAIGIFYHQLGKAGRSAPATDEEREQLRRLSIIALTLASVILAWSLLYALFWVFEAQRSFGGDAAMRVQNWLPQLGALAIGVMLTLVAVPQIEETDVDDIEGMAMASMIIGGMGGVFVLWIAICGCSPHSAVVCGPSWLRKLTLDYEGF